MTTADAAAGWRTLWRNRDFRRFVGGQFVTNAGDSLYSVAVLWLVFELSGSTVLTGVANAVLLLPWLLQIVAGPVVDRLPLKPLLVGSQLVQGLVVLVLPLAAATGRLSVALLFGVLPVLMLATLVMSPMQATVVPRIVDDRRLSSANSALATVTLGLDMLFDALGGAFIALFGVTTLFLFDAATFAVASVLFAGIVIPTAPSSRGAEGGGSTAVEEGGSTAADGGKPVDDGADTPEPPNSDGDTTEPPNDEADTSEPPNDETDTTEPPNDEADTSEPPNDEADTTESVLRAYLGDMRAGIDVLRGTVFVELILTTAVANLATGVTLAVLPAFGDGLGGPAVYGLLLGALGTGRLVGSLLGPYFEGVAYGRFSLVGFSLAGCSWLGAAYAPTPALTVVLFGLAWVPSGISGVLTSTLNQTVFPADLLGRISSVKGTASGATLPLGSLVGGVVADALGVTATMGLAAAGFGFTGAYFLLRPRLRRLPAIADATADDFDVTLPAGSGRQ